MPIVKGYYVDEAIKTISLPPIKRGENILEIKMPFKNSTNLEYCYILGEFNVKIEGCEKTIIAPTETIGFSSITNQGMPFYGGNITYIMELETTKCCCISIKASNYRGAAIKAAIDGKSAGIIAYAPYKVMAENIKPGKHKIELTLYGNRYNTFAALHNTNTANRWYGPDIWRTQGDEWCYEYKLKDTGILASPIIEIFQTN